MNDDKDHIESERDLAEALDRWGSNLDTWPRAAAAKAKLLVATSPEATRLMRETVSLELELAQLREHRATHGLDAKILAELPVRDGLQRVVDWLTSTLWRPALAAAVPLVLGFILGTTVLPFLSRRASQLNSACLFS